MDILHLSKLSRIKVSEKESKELQKDLDAILGYVNQLKKVDVSGVSEFTNAVEVFNVVRADDAENPFGKREDLVQAASAREKGFVKVKAVFER